MTVTEQGLYSFNIRVSQEEMNDLGKGMVDLMDYLETLGDVDSAIRVDRYMAMFLNLDPFTKDEKEVKGDGKV